MTKIIVDLISARDLRNERGYLDEVNPYIQFKVGEKSFTSQKFTTKNHKNPEEGTLDFDETFEFEVNGDDELFVKFYDDNEGLVEGGGIGETEISLKEVLDSGSMQSWFPLKHGIKFSGEVLLNIHT